MKLPPFIEYSVEGDVDEQRKRWLYSNAYFLKELRDISHLLHHLKPIHSRKTIIDLIKKNVVSQGASWTDRRIIECLNALVNFKVIDKDLVPINDWFKDSISEADLTPHELSKFEEVYLSYLSFIDFHSLFLQKGYSITSLRSKSPYQLKEILKLDSQEIITASSEGSYVDRFYCLGINDSYALPSGLITLKVFWDVYITWGKTLGLLEVVSFNKLTPDTQSKLLNVNKLVGLKRISIVYFLSGNRDGDINEIVKKFFRKKYVFIPDLIIIMSIRLRIDIAAAKNLVVAFINNNKRNLTVERTSEIFIKNSDKFLFPIINDSFVSHLLFR